MNLTQEMANKIWDYRDGKLYWKIHHVHWQPLKIGSLAGGLSGGKYLKTSFYGVKHAVHRLVFLMHHGYLPKEVDHINGNPLDNRIENLRAATRSENCCNRKLFKNNIAGHTGISIRSSGKYRTRISKNKKTYCLGDYDTLEEAVQVLENARKKLHGNFAYAK